MYRDMDQWIEIRRRVLVAGVSKRQIQRETGMHWQALEKILHHVEPPGDRGPRRRASRRSDPAFRGSLRSWMPTSNCRRSRGIPPSGSGKGSRTKKEFDGGYTTVKDAVRQSRSRRQEVFMPLVHRPAVPHRLSRAIGESDGLSRLPGLSDRSIRESLGFRSAEPPIGFVVACSVGDSVSP